MEDESAVLETDTLVENTETLDVSPPLESVQDREEETGSSPHNVAETAEDDVLEQEPQFSVETQEGLLTEDKSMIPSDGEKNGPGTTELGPCEEEAEIGPKINKVIEDPEGEDLSQEGIITADDVEEKNKPQTPDSCMPDSPPEEPLVAVEEEERLKDLLHQLQEENDKLSKLNGQLQSKIAEHLRRKVNDNKQQKLTKDITDQQQYQNYMDLLEDLKCQHQCNLDLNQQRIQKLCQQSQEKVNQVKCELQSFALVKNEAAVTALTGKVGKQTTLEKVEQLLADEQKKEEQLVCVRLCNIKLKNKLCKFEATLQSQRKLTDGLLLMDFEQLKTENRTLKERFKDRNGELLRLHNKIACSVQGITHIKEKMHFIQKENVAKRTQLAEVDAMLALKRDVLTRTRQARDNLRIDNLKLQQQCGLLGNTTLLRDFEERVDTSESLQQRLETMKRRHAELVLKCAGVKQKIEQSKPEVPAEGGIY